VTHAFESAMMAKLPKSNDHLNDFYDFNQVVSIIDLTEFGMRFLGFKPGNIDSLDI